MLQQATIAIVSNNVIESEQICSLIKKEGYNAFFYSEASKSNIDIISNQKPNIVFVDLDLNKTDGIELCYFLKNEKKLSSYIVLFSTKDEEYIEIEAFKAGADDYILKPIKPKIFIRKINALIRRNSIDKKSGYEPKTLTYKDVVVDLETYTVFKGNNPKHLPRKDFEILQLFILNPKKVYSREEIYHNIWSSIEAFNPRIVDVHIRKIREKVGNHFIETIKGAGYRLSS